jgi:tyrosine-protein phosphatase SIW14
MVRFGQLVLGLCVVVLLIGGPVGYAYYRQTNLRNFHAVREGVLYRSGQMTIAGLKSVVHDHGIKTVVSLRDSVYSNDPPPDLAEENYCLAEAIRYVRISPRSWWAPDGSIPAEIGVNRFLEVMDDPTNYPVLIHCFGGIHRTGAFCAVYRMDKQHWTNEQAIQELRAGGYKELTDDWDLLHFLKKYQPRWQRQRQEQGQSCETTQQPRN